jgi:hypothetical protein
MSKKHQESERKKKRGGRTREQDKERWKKDAERRESGDTPGQAPLPGRGQGPDKSPGTS